jgi:hypothetical protein
LNNVYGTNIRYLTLQESKITKTESVHPANGSDDDVFSKENIQHQSATSASYEALSRDIDYSRFLTDSPIYFHHEDYRDGQLSHTTEKSSITSLLLYPKAYLDSPLSYVNYETLFVHFPTSSVHALSSPDQIRESLEPSQWYTFNSYKPLDVITAENSLLLTQTSTSVSHTFSISTKQLPYIYVKSRSLTVSSSSAGDTISCSCAGLSQDTTSSFTLSSTSPNLSQDTSTSFTDLSPSPVVSESRPCHLPCTSDNVSLLQSTVNLTFETVQQFISHTANFVCHGDAENALLQLDLARKVISVNRPTIQKFCAKLRQDFKRFKSNE